MDFGRALFGPIGGSVFAFMVAFSCFGALNGLWATLLYYVTDRGVIGSFFTSSRLIYAAGRERYLPAIFGQLHPIRRTPLNAALLQSAITVAFIMIGNGFRSLINFSVVASWAFYFLTVSILTCNSPCFNQPFSGLGTCHFTNKRTNAWKVCAAQLMFQNSESSFLSDRTRLGLSPPWLSAQYVSC